jgi:hypothetical protein
MRNFLIGDWIAVERLRAWGIAYVRARISALTR